jgi:predicted ATPase/class 3 adenylate cyclase
MTQPRLWRDRYESLGVAGEGGQGSVLRARDHQHDRLVALKVRPAGADADRARLLTEARVLLGLRPHPNLPLVRDDFFHEDQYVIVMDWIEGLDLAQILADRGDPGLPLGTVIGYLEPVAEALDHLHAHHPPIVHGDVKPANLIHTPGAAVQLVDFGVSDVAGAGDRSGSRGFRAPEVATGAAPSPASDIYAFAATACALLTGRAPTEGRPTWEGLDPVVVSAVERAVARGLSVEPARRPGSAREFLDRLRSARAPQLPTGVVTFLLTDIESSTALWETDARAMSEALARHESLIAEVVEEHGGTLVKSRGEGDSTMSVYSQATDAVEAAIAMQRAVATEAWPGDLELLVRVALHTGQAEVRRGDYFGQTLNRAARVRSLAAGGEILMSQATAQVVADAMPEGAELLDRGEHELRGLSRPERVFELGFAVQPSAEGARGDQDPGPTARAHDVVVGSQPPRTSFAERESEAEESSGGTRGPQAVRVSLPSPRTSFVGRVGELGDVLAALTKSRLVTLTGVGGTGKTRLAIEAAKRDAARHRDGVFFVDLAPQTDGENVATAVASALNAQGDASDVVEMVLSFLTERKALIVLDNCEQVIDACAQLVDRILATCSSMSVLATSREPLQIEREKVVRVPPMAAADESSDAIELFVARARSVNEGFRLSQTNLPLVIDICTRLDGIPLAIELASSRVDQHSVADIADRLSQRFRLLVGGRDRPERQQTLQTAMDSSWELLSDGEKQVFRRLAVFAGTFTLEAAEGVCGPSTIDVIGPLVRKSLVVLDDDTGHARYRLLETVRLYASERLIEAGEADVIRDAHRDWYLNWSEALSTIDYFDARYVNAFTREYTNIRAAMDRSAEQARPDLFARQLLTIGTAWQFDAAMMEESRAALREVGSDELLSATTRADAFAALALVSMYAGDVASVYPAAQRSLELNATDRRYLPAALFGTFRYAEAAEAARRLHQPTFARFCLIWDACFGIIVDARAALERLKALATELDIDASGWDSVFTHTALVVTKVILDDGTAEADVEHARAAWHGVSFGDEPKEFYGPDLARFDSSIGVASLYGDILEAVVHARSGRFEAARGALLPITRATLRDRFPLVGFDCLIAFAYIAFREGDATRAALLLEPVTADGRARMLPMGAFGLWLLSELNARLADQGIESPLPDRQLALTRTQQLMTGNWQEDRTVVHRIYATLAREFDRVKRGDEDA